MPAPTLDIMASARAVPFRRAAAAVLGAVVVSLCLGSQALLDWANALPINRASDAVLAGATAWHEAMERVELTAVAEELRAEFRRFEERRREGR
ncbi:MAG TPA: hypothetical protein VMU06_08800 [Stellaceae bacterium]|nr:hypothetical protein [Stellaceae bacterium]